jgi:hypothetical protein
MASLLLTYSGMAGGQHLIFKPTLLAALLASGVGSYLYLDPPQGGSQRATQTGRTDSKSDFDASFYGAARAAEPQVQVRFAPAEVKPGIGQSSLLPLTANDFGPVAFIESARLEERSQSPAMIGPQLVPAGPELKRDLDANLPEPKDAEFAAIFNQWESARPEVPIAFSDPGATPQLTMEPAKAATESGIARVDAREPSPPSPVSALADATAPGAQAGSLLEGAAIESVSEAALANLRQSLPTGPIEPAASAIPLVAPSPLQASAELVVKSDTGPAAVASAAQLAVSAATLAPQALAPAAPPQEAPRTELVAAVAPAVGQAPAVAAQPAAKPAGLSDMQQPSGPAPIALQPIKFKLQPTAKSATPSAGLAAARRSERASQAVKPGSNGFLAQKRTRLPDRLVGEYIFHQVSVRLNDSPAGNVDVRIGGDASLSIKVGTLLSVVEGRLDPALYAALSQSAGADAYVSFRELRAAGIDVRYEPAGDTIVLTAD